MDYSQYEEQIYIKNFFGDYIGSCLDVGAADGVTFSNVYQLLLDGWKCVSVEPETQTFRQLINHYEQFGNRAELMVAVIDPVERFVTFYENGQLSSTSAEHMAAWDWHKQEHGYEWKAITHRTVTLNSLLSHYSDKKFDFISVDLEGQNLEVIKATDWNLAPDCKLLCIEHDDSEEAIIETLSPYGFTQLCRTPVNLIMSR